MFRRRMAALVCALLAAVLAACGMVPEQTGEQVLYNGYLGLTVTVPAGWYLEELNRQNLTAAPEESQTLEQMDFSPNGDGGSMATLVSLESRLSSRQDDHVNLMLFAEQYTDIFFSVDEYVEDYLFYVLGDIGDGYYADLTDIDEVELSGVPFTRITVTTVYGDDAETTYLSEHYITRIGELFLVGYVDYWADGAQNQATAREALERCVALTETDHPDTAPGENTYHNGYLGLVVRVPRGRYYMTVNEINMTLVPEDSDDLSLLSLGDYGDDGFYFDLLTMQTDLFDEDGSYAAMELYAVSDGAVDGIEAFVEQTRDSTLAIAGSAITRTLRTSTIKQLGGEQYHLLVFDLTDGDTGEKLVEEIYMREVRDLFFVARLQYHDTPDAAAEALQMLGTFTMTFAIPTGEDNGAGGFVI